MARDGQVIGEKRNEVQGAIAGNYALEFDGNDFVELADAFDIGQVKPITLEAWVMPMQMKSDGRNLVFAYETTKTTLGMGISSKTRRWIANGGASIQSRDVVVFQRPVRIALSSDGEKQYLFVDGKLEATGPTVKGRPTFKGRMTMLSLGQDFIGQIDDIRISKICRYTADYTPGRPENDKDTLALYHCDEGTGNVLKDSSGNGHDGKIVGAKWVKGDGTPIVPSGNYVLEFDGDAFVKLPELKTKFPIRPNDPLTIEAWAKPTQAKSRDGRPENRPYVILSDSYNSGIYIELGKKKWAGAVYNLPRSYSTNPAELSRPVHLAVTFDGEAIHLFVDGKLEMSEPMKQSAFFRGSLSLGNNFIGQIDDIRISNVCRYTADYTPGRPESDKDTLALYHCDEGTGEVLKDSSGNGHDGKIVGAKWVKAAPSEAPIPAPQVALQFDAKSRVNVPSLKLDLYRPFTLEGYITQEGLGQCTSLFGMNLINIRGHDSSTWALYVTSEEIKNSFILQSDIAVQKGRKTHVAAVVSGAEIRLFVDGVLAGKKVVAEGSLSKQKTPFEMGYDFSGKIQEVRVSRVARYDKNFKPETRFEPDAQTLAIYHMDEGEGNILKDSSGNGHHGKIVGAKWVKAEPPTSLLPTNSRSTLAFERNRDRVEIKNFNYPEDGPITIEAMVDLKQLRVGPILAMRGRKVEFVLYTTNILSPRANGGFAVHHKNGTDDTLGAIPLSSGVAHVCGTWDGAKSAFYINGKRSRDFLTRSNNAANGPFGPGRLWFGSEDQDGVTLLGTIAGARISKGLRYASDFQPPKGFAKDPDTLALYRFDDGEGDVLTDSSGNGHDGKIIGAKWVKAEGVPLKLQRYALEFTDDEPSRPQYFDAPMLIDRAKPFTVEGYFTVTSAKSRSTLGLIHLNGMPRLTYVPVWTWGYEHLVDGKKTLAHVRSTVEPALHRRIHLAGVRTADKLLLFVDGKMLGSADVPPGTLTGTSSVVFGGNLIGTLDQVRISTAARYDKDFTPPAELTAEPGTEGLYLFEEGKGDTVADASGRNHHGRIVGAKWVKGDGTPPSVSQTTNFALAFEKVGDSYVAIPSLKLPASADFTMEGFATWDDRKGSDGVIDFLGCSELPISVYLKDKKCGLGFYALSNKKMRTVRADVPKDGRFHVAAVRTKGGVYLYIDGKKVAEDKNEPWVYAGANPFRLGGPGFAGTLSEVRFSSSARYTSDFKPAPRHIPDNNTLALYHFDEGEGDVLKDSSGKGHHGRIVGAKRVRADAVPIVPPPSQSQ